MLLVFYFIDKIMIKIDNIKKNYNDFHALSGVSFNIPKGKITALLGANGAGKTTIMKIITGFISSNSGKVYFDEEELNEQSLKIIQQKIGYLPENAPLYHEITIYEYLEFAARLHGIKKSTDVKKSISRVADLCNLKSKMYFNISELSKGYKQRVCLAQALIHDPEILILDEPTTGLDPRQILEIRDLIKSWGAKKTILLSTHIMQEVEAIAEKVVVIEKGKIVTEEYKDNLLKSSKDKVNIIVEIENMEQDKKSVKKILENIGYIDSVEIKDKRFFCLTEEKNRARILQDLVKNDVEILSVYVEKISMEDIFINLTK